MRIESFQQYNFEYFELLCLCKCLQLEKMIIPSLCLKKLSIKSSPPVIMFEDELEK